MAFIEINFNSNRKLMAVMEQFQTVLLSMNENLTNVLEDIIYIKERLENALNEDGGLSAEDEEEVLDGLQAVADRIAGLAAATEDRPIDPPVEEDPPVDPPVDEPA